jgi:hypothetical protein
MSFIRGMPILLLPVASDTRAMSICGVALSASIFQNRQTLLQLLRAVSGFSEIPAAADVYDWKPFQDAHENLCW